MLLLLTPALATSPVGNPPEADVAFGGPDTVRVIGPSNRGREEYPWTVAETLMSPRGDAAAVRFCWEIGKYDGCQVHLARPGQPVTVLKNSNVKKLLWTGDGRYLIGAGTNTVRLWNLVGGVRVATPKYTLAIPGLQPDAAIKRSWLNGRNLCVSVREDWYAPDGSGRPEQSTLTTVRYALPTLRPVEVVMLPFRAGQQTPCHMPESEPET